MKIETLNPIKILIFGDERFDFIQNIITNDLSTKTSGIYSYILTPQGKILFEIQIFLLKDCLEVICSNDQTDLLLYFEKYAKLSEVSLKKIELDKFNFGESYLFKSLRMGKIDTNFFPHSTLLPSEVHDEYINYQKGCFIGQEVVSRIKHRQLQKKIILVFERIIPRNTKFPDNFELLIEIKNLLVLRLPKDVDFSYLEKEFDIKKI